MFRDKLPCLVYRSSRSDDLQESHVGYIYGGDSQFLRVEPEGVKAREPEYVRNEAKMPGKDFHQYCLISKIRILVRNTTTGNVLQVPNLYRLQEQDSALEFFPIIRLRVGNINAKIKSSSHNCRCWAMSQSSFGTTREKVTVV